MRVREWRRIWPGGETPSLRSWPSPHKLFPQGFGVDFHRVFHPHPVPGLGEHVGDLQHAGGAAGGHHRALGLGDVLPLAPADGLGGLVLLQVETAAAAAAPIRLGHLLNS